MQRFPNRPHIYRAPDNVIPSVSYTPGQMPITFKDGERAATLEDAQARFVAVMNEHEGPLNTLFRAAHKNRKASFGPSRDNDAEIFKETLKFITADVENYVENPKQDLAELYVQQARRQNGINKSLRDLRLYCEEKGSLKEETVHFFASAERAINAAHVDFCYKQATQNRVAKRREAGIREELTNIIENRLGGIKGENIANAVNAFMDAVHSYPNFLAIYTHIRTILKANDDKKELQNLLWNIHLKAPNTAAVLGRFARDGALRMEKFFKKHGKADALKITITPEAKPEQGSFVIEEKAVIDEPVSARGHDKYGPYDTSFRNIVEKPTEPIRKERALLTAKDSEAIDALTKSYIPVKAPAKDEKIIPQSIKIADPIGNTQQNQKWHQRLGTALRRNAVKVATGIAAVVAVVIAAVTFMHKTPDVQVASTSTPNTTMTNPTPAPTPPVTPTLTPTISTAEAPTVSPTLNIPLSDAPEITSTDFQTAKPTALQKVISNTLAAGPLASVTPSWAAQGTLGLDVDSLSKTFADQTSSAEKNPEKVAEEIVEKPAEKTAAKTSTKPATAKAQTPQTGEQISYQFAKFGGKNLQSVTYDEGTNTVEADFGNNYEKAFDAARKMLKNGNIKAKEVSIRNGVVRLVL